MGMSRIAAVRFLGLYAPMLTAFIIAIARPRMPRMLPSALLSFLWTLPSLLALQLLNLRVGWWDFHAEGALFRGMPLDQYLGWAVLWGLVPIFGFRKIAVCFVVMLFFGLDLILMPACSPLLVLIPSQLLARWILNDTHLKVRTTLQVFVASGVFLFLLPEIVFGLRRNSGWKPLLYETTWIRNLEFQGV